MTTATKKESIVEAGRDLFFRHGIRRVTVAEICRAAGSSKMTFYRHFANKDALVIHILGAIVDEQMALFESMAKEETPFAEKMERLIAMKADMIQQFSKEFMNDLLSGESQAGLYLLKRRQEADKTIRLFYADAKRKGQIRKDINLDFLLYLTEHFRQLMADPNLDQLFSHPVELMRELLDFYLYGMLGSNGRKS